MKHSELKKFTEDLLAVAGISINGPNPYDIQVYNDDFFKRVITDGSLGFGEAYMEKWWDCQDLQETVYRIKTSNLENHIKPSMKLALFYFKTKFFNFQSLKQASNDVRKHYDLGNDLFISMLDKRLVYTCGYWKNASTLDNAQEEKLDLVCKKIGLKSGMKILDVGCGWGSFAKFAAEKYDAHVTGITIAPEQIKLARELCKGLPVEIRLQDYRDVNEKFDHIISLGMFEHVGYKNYPEFMKIMHRCLKDDGLFLLHTLGSDKSWTCGDAWLNKYIFPNGMLPSIKQIGESIENLFTMEDWHNFSAYYEPTLQEWFKNFDTNWANIKEQYDDRFYRMWKFYLLGCAGFVKARGMQLWQIVLSKKGIPGGYVSVR